MSILTHDEAKRLSQSSTDPLEVIRNVEAAVIIKLAGSQNAPKDEIRLIWKPKCDALRQRLEAAQAEAADGYAARMAEARRYGAMAVALEAAQSRIDFKEMVIERNAELARLAEIENQEPAYLLTPDGKCYAYGSAQPLSAGHADATLLKLYAAAGASPVEPLTNTQIEKGMMALLWCAASDLGRLSPNMYEGYKDDVTRVYSAITTETTRN